LQPVDQVDQPSGIEVDIALRRGLAVDRREDEVAG
jgi:hypothetical protein